MFQLWKRHSGNIIPRYLSNISKCWEPPVWRHSHFLGNYFPTALESRGYTSTTLKGFESTSSIKLLHYNRIVRSWPAINFLSYPSLHLLPGSRPREVTSTVLRQDSTQASPSASHPNFSKAFSNPSISSNFEHIFPQNYWSMIAFPTLNLKGFKC